MQLRAALAPLLLVHVSFGGRHALVNGYRWLER